MNRKLSHLASILRSAHFKYLSLLVGLVSLATFYSTVMEVNAQAEGEWSPPVIVRSETVTRWTKLSVGFEGELNSFWAATDDTGTSNPYSANYHSIFHSSSRDGSEWQEPADIIFDANRIDALAVIKTAMNYVVVWNSDCIHAATSSPGNLSSPRTWIQLDYCIRDRSTPEGLAITYDNSSGRIYLAVAAARILSLMVSADYGLSWGVISSIALPPKASHILNFPRIAFSQIDSTIHVVWSEQKSRSEQFEMVGVFYARSSNNGETWSTPFQLATGNYTHANLVTDRGDVHVVWNSGVGESKRLHRWSSDTGFTWSPEDAAYSARDFSDLAGKQGPPGISEGPTDSIYVLVGTNNGVRLRRWQNGLWEADVDGLDSEGVGETWLTDLVKVGETRICAYWSATQMPVFGFSITCKGPLPNPEELVTREDDLENNTGNDSGPLSDPGLTPNDNVPSLDVQNNYSVSQSSDSGSSDLDQSQRSTPIWVVILLSASSTFVLIIIVVIGRSLRVRRR